MRPRASTKNGAQPIASGVRSALFERRLNSQRTGALLCLILGLGLVMGILYASVVPLWQAPDEPKHFEHIALLHQKGRLVSHEDAYLPLQQRIISSMKDHDYWKFGYANSPQDKSFSFADIWKLSPTQLDRPPLYYLAASVFFRPFLDAPVDLQLYVLRLFSVVLGGSTILMVFLTVRTVFPKDAYLALLAASLVTFLPMQTFVSSSFNSDNMANLLAATFAYALARIFMKNASPASVAGVLALLLAGLWTKRTTLFAVPLAAVSVPIYLGSKRLTKRTRPILVVIGLVSTAAVVSLVLLEGPRSLVAWVLDRYVFNVSASANLSLFLQKDYSPGALLQLYVGFARDMFRSFWAQFGWMNVRLDDIWYALLFLFSLLVLIGFLNYGRLLAQGREKLDMPQSRLMVIFLIWVAVVVAIPLIQYTADYNAASFPQGRYLFPALVPLATFAALGIKHLVPRRSQPAMIFLAIAGIFLLNALSLVYYIIPYYY